MAKGDVLVIGQGGREHAIVWKLTQSQHVKHIYIAPGNEGTSEFGKNISIEAHEIYDLCDFARQKEVDLTVVGSELPLSLGIVDLFLQYDLDIFGPTKEAAMLETSKVFGKILMTQVGIPTAPYEIFSSYRSAYAHIRERSYPLVVKADGLASGKGVYVCKSLNDADIALNDLMGKRIYGKSGDMIIIEDFLKGDELSIHALCGGIQSTQLLTSRDAKRLNDNDKGPNTGGMGAYAPVSCFTNKQMFHVEQSIMPKTLDELVKRGTPYTGCLYPGLMIYEGMPYVLEFNVRFGDPETQVLMMLMESDLFLLLKSWIKNRPLNAVFMENMYAVCVVICSGGYPISINNPVPIYGIERAQRLSHDVMIFHAGTTSRNSIVYGNGRMLGVTARAKTLNAARDLAYQACELIDVRGQYRTDIALDVS